MTNKKKLIDTNCCQLCQKTLTNLVSFLTFCSSWSLQCISAGTAWKHQGPLGRKYSWQLSGQTIATSLKTDSGGSVGKRCIFAILIFLQLCDSIALDIFPIQLWPFSECNGSFSFKCYSASPCTWGTWTQPHSLPQLFRISMTGNWWLDPVATIWMH